METICGKVQDQSLSSMRGVCTSSAGVNGARARCFFSLVCHCVASSTSARVRPDGSCRAALVTAVVSAHLLASLARFTSLLASKKQPSRQQPVCSGHAAQTLDASSTQNGSPARHVRGY